MARRDSRDGNALKETRVIWQSATLCRVKKAASSLNNARLFRSQRFRSNRPLAATLEPSNRVAFSCRAVPRFRAVRMQMVRIWVAPFRQSGGGREREARTAQSMKNNLGEILGISRLGPAFPFFVEFTTIDRGWKYDRRGRITLVAAIKDKESVNR